MTVTNELALKPMEFRYDFNNKNVRSIILNDQPWFVARDVCEALTLVNSRKAVKALDGDQKLMSQIVTSGQRRQHCLINESGLYSLIFRSNKPEAKIFSKWVTTEVLPALRKHGNYAIAKTHTPGSSFPGVYRFTSTQMLEIIKTVNHRPINKSVVMELLFKGGTI